MEEIYAKYRLPIYDDDLKASILSAMQECAEKKLAEKNDWGKLKKDYSEWFFSMKFWPTPDQQVEWFKTKIIPEPLPDGEYVLDLIEYVKKLKYMNGTKPQFEFTAKEILEAWQDENINPETGKPYFSGLDPNKFNKHFGKQTPAKDDLLPNLKKSTENLSKIKDKDEWLNEVRGTAQDDKQDDWKPEVINGFIQIAIDRKTLPKDGQHIEFITDKEDTLQGYFVEGDDIFHVTESLWFFKWYVHQWKAI